MQITKKIHALKHIFTIPVTPDVMIERFVYSFIILGDKSVYLIDSGVSASGNSIIKYISDRNSGAAKIKFLFLTHSHPDHIGSAKYIRDISECKILAHINEKDWIEDIDKQFIDRPVPGFKNLVGGSVCIERFINDNEIIQLENDLSLKIIHTPGHSNGSISLLIENEGVLFSGDSILLPGELPIYENFEETVSSVNKLKKIKTLKVLLSSWDAPAYDSYIIEKMDQSINYLLKIHKIIKGINKANEYQPLELCRIVVEKLGLPQAAINQLVAKSFQSNLKFLDSFTL